MPGRRVWPKCMNKSRITNLFQQDETPVAAAQVSIPNFEALVSDPGRETRKLRTCWVRPWVFTSLSRRNIQPSRSNQTRARRDASSPGPGRVARGGGPTARQFEERGRLLRLLRGATTRGRWCDDADQNVIDDTPHYSTTRWVHGQGASLNAALRSGTGRTNRYQLYVPGRRTIVNRVKWHWLLLFLCNFFNNLLLKFCLSHKLNFRQFQPILIKNVTIYIV